VTGETTGAAAHESDERFAASTQPGGFMRIVAVMAVAGVLIGRGGHAEPHDVAAWSGTLLDASCTDRSLENLRAQPSDVLATDKNPQKKAVGITVDPKTLKAERAEATMPQTADHASRYSSASCALTADTKAFLLLLADGKILTLDEGGNTLAFEAFQASPAGAAILNGKVGGLKPKATVKGVVSGGRLRVRSLELK
jgi:hypothetical protein